jgi:DDE superfamily endonuclease
MGHPVRFSDALAMPKHVYWKLVKELQLYAGLTHSKYVLLEEQVAMFLHFCKTGGTVRYLRERFQHSPSTISKYGLQLELMFCSFHNDSYSSIIHRILDMVVSPTFYNRYVKLPPAEQTPPEIQNDPKLYPFFKDCRGAIDGTHIEAFVPDDAMARYRNRKGFLSQNVLAACTFDMRFCYVLPGWEGSASDGRVFDDARRHSLAIPPGTYFLADAGFPTCAGLIVPFTRTRYHLKEWARAPERSVIYIYILVLHADCVL